MSCRVTIAIPVYNVERYVAKSLRSALGQNTDVQYEILVVDDCGTDSSMDIVRQIQAEEDADGKIVIVQHEYNKGLGEASNTAIANAKGDYLLFLDSDDYLEANALQTLYDKAKEIDADVVIGSYREVDENGKRLREHVFADRTIIHEHALVYDFRRHHREPNIHRWNKLLSMKLLRDNDIRCVHRIMEDSVFDFNVRALASRVAIVSDVTLNYTIRENSIMTSVQRTGGTDRYAEVYADIIKQVQRLISERYYDIPGIYNYYYQRLYGSLLQLERTRYDERQRQLFEQAAEGCNDFVPSLRSLDLTRYRFVYLWCRWHGKQDCDTFISGYRQSRKPWGYAARLLLWLIPNK